MSRSLWQRCGRWWPAAGLGALSVAGHAWDLWKEVALIFITSTVVWHEPRPSTESESEVTQSCLTPCHPMDYIAYKVPPATEFSRQEYWSGLPFPSPTENWIKNLWSMAPPISTRPSFPLSQSLPSGSFHKPLILLHQRTDEWKPQSQKTNQSDHMDLSPL